MRTGLHALLCLLSLCLTTASACARIDWSPTEQEWVTKHVGMYIWGPGDEGGAPSPHYNRADLSVLSKHLGTRVVRTYLGGYDTPAADDAGRPLPQRTYIDNLGSPTYRELIGNFDVIMFTMSFPGRMWTEPDWTRERYREVTEFLLRTYPRKTFILGNWEGDYWVPGEHTWEQALALWSARHDGIVAGRAAVPAATAKVYDMVEMVLLDFSGKEKMINNLVPHLHADLYSLSAWGYYGDLAAAVEYMKSKCPDSPDFGDDNVMIGEIGWSGQSPADRIRWFHDRLLELRDVKVPFVVIWALTDHGLTRPKVAGGQKLSTYYQFYRAYHSQDRNLLVDDFEADPLGSAGGERNEDGYSMNNLGGRRSAVGDAGAAHVWLRRAWGKEPSRVLELTLPRGAAAGSGWDEHLLRLNARRFARLGFRARGDISSFDLVLTDVWGRSAKVSLAGYRSGRRWQPVVIERDALAGVDWSNLDRITWLLRQPGRARTLLLDTVWFSGPDGDILGDGPAAAATPRLSHVTLRSTSRAVPRVGPMTSVTLTTVATDAPVTKPTLVGTDGSVCFAESLGALQSITLSSNGRGRVEMGPLYHNVRPAFFPKARIAQHGLDLNQQYLRLYPAAADQTGYLEWWFSSQFPVTGFEFTLFGADNRPVGGEMGISYSTDGVTWQECAITRGDSTWPRIVDGVIGRPPAGYTPSPRIGVRFWIKTAGTADNWYWNASIADVQARLDLDASKAVLPQRDVRYQDESSALQGYRGLLDIE